MDNVFKICDDRFKIEEIDQHVLIMQISVSRFKFIIKKKETVYWLEDHFLGVDIGFTNAANKVAEIINNHTFLAANFWKEIKIIYNTPFFILISEALNNDGDEFSFLKSCFPRNNSFNFISNSHKINKHILLSQYPAVFAEIFNKIYPSKDLLEVSLPALVLNHFTAENNLKDKNYIFVDDKYMYVLAMIKETITFNCIPLISKNIGDFLSKNLSNSENKYVEYFGEITEYSPFYRLLKENVQKISLGKNQGMVKLTQYFGVISEHRYLSLFIA
jgi:hypothetical protein